ncbi:hypothetical protein RJ641_001737 [Dillenia turbinata]|uniref:F-box domain-containing protein n=1 Tax=Dillenia turbinata TaxID=194707 RepID=A0AAN8VQP1_9MAGN
MAADCEFSSSSSQSEESSSKEKLGTIEILINAQRVCKLWWKLCKDPAMWRTIDLNDLKYCRDMDLDPEKVARNAVEWSCGELVDISIEDFGTDILMEYITARASNLKRLRLGLIDAAKKLPQLKDLEISLCSFTRECLEIVGRCCPGLRTLKYNKRGYRLPLVECDEEALAIAELTNDGLQAILDGCPHLEYLDLRWCFNIALPGELGRRCGERLKILRRPNDPTDDYEFHTQNQYISDLPSDIDTSFFHDYEFDYDDFFFPSFMNKDHYDQLWRLNPFIHRSRCCFSKRKSSGSLFSAYVCYPKLTHKALQ